MDMSFLWTLRCRICATSPSLRTLLTQFDVAYSSMDSIRVQQDSTCDYVRENQLRRLGRHIGVRPLGRKCSRKHVANAVVELSSHAPVDSGRPYHRRQRKLLSSHRKHQLP